MNLLADPQILAALLTVALTAIAAAGGYYLRERISRVTPFMAITKIDGDTKRSATRIEVPAKIVKALHNSSIQSPLPEKAQLPEIGNALSLANDLNGRGTEYLELVAQFLASAKSSDVVATQTAMAEIMIDDDFDSWISTLIGDRVIPVPQHDPSLPILIECSEEPSFRNGSFAVGFPGRGLRFGSNLNDFTLYKSGLASLMELVRRMELQKLATVFEESRTHVERNISIAKDIAPALQEIVDKHSQWSIRIFLANLGHAPILVQTHGTLEIRDRSGAKYTQDCSLLVVAPTEDGEPDRFEATSPLVVRSESDVTFEFCTDSTQSEMPAGDTIRSLFRAGSATCFVRFNGDRPGLHRRQEFKTPLVPFRET